MGLFGKSKEEKQEEWYTKGEALSELGQYEESIVCFDKALEINTKNIPTIAHAWYMKSQSFFGMELFDESLTSCDEAIRLHPSAYRPMRCTILLLLKRYEEVVTYCDEIISSNHGDDSVLNTKGIALAQLGRHEEAILCYEEIINNATQMFEPEQISSVWKNKGVSLKQLGRVEEAVTCFDEAIRLNPDDTDVLSKRDDAVTTLKNDKSIVLDDVNSMEQKNMGGLTNDSKVDEWNDKGNSLVNLEKFEESIACFDQAIKIDPENSSVWHNKAVSLRKLDRHEEAVTCCDEVIRLNPEDEVEWYNKGFSLMMLVKFEKSILCFDEAIRLNPNYLPAWGNKGGVLSRLGRYEEAIVCIDETIRLNPGDSHAWGNKGVTLKKLGRGEEAEQCFTKSKELE